MNAVSEHSTTTWLMFVPGAIPSVCSAQVMAPTSVLPATKPPMPKNSTSTKASASSTAQPIYIEWLVDFGLLLQKRSTICLLCTTSWVGQPLSSFSSSCSLPSFPASRTSSCDILYALVSIVWVLEQSMFAWQPMVSSRSVFTLAICFMNMIATACDTGFFFNFLFMSPI